MKKSSLVLLSLTAFLQMISINTRSTTPSMEKVKFGSKYNRITIAIFDFILLVNTHIFTTSHYPIFSRNLRLDHELKRTLARLNHQLSKKTQKIQMSLKKH